MVIGLRFKLPDLDESILGHVLHMIKAAIMPCGLWLRHHLVILVAFQLGCFPLLFPHMVGSHIEL